MEELTKAKKVQALRTANPKLGHEDACLLLGFNPNDPLCTMENPFEFMGDGFSFNPKQKRESANGKSD